MSIRLPEGMKVLVERRELWGAKVAVYGAAHWEGHRYDGRRRWAVMVDERRHNTNLAAVIETDDNDAGRRAALAWISGSFLLRGTYEYIPAAVRMAVSHALAVGEVVPRG